MKHTTISFNTPDGYPVAISSWSYDHHLKTWRSNPHLHMNEYVDLLPLSEKQKNKIVWYLRDYCDCRWFEIHDRANHTSWVVFASDYEHAIQIYATKMRLKIVNDFSESTAVWYVRQRNEYPKTGISFYVK